MNLRVILMVLGWLWSKRNNLAELKIQLSEVISSIQVARQDKKITKQELMDIVEECEDVLNAIKGVIL